MKKGTAGPKNPATPQEGAATSGDVAPPFDPFSASFEKAERLQGLATEDGPEGPLFQWVEAQRLTDSRARVEAGTGFDVLEAVAGCALHGLVMPDWLARAYLKRYRQVKRLHVNSWDAESAFGKPYPPKAQVGAMRRRRDMRMKVWRVVTDYVKRHPDRPMDPLWQVFDASAAEHTAVPPAMVAVVRQIGCSRSTAQELYREACEGLCLPNDHAIRAGLTRVGLPASSRKVAGRPKQA